MMEATQEALERAGREASPWLRRGARLGALSRGTIYVVVGGFALEAALGSHGHPTGPRGAFDAIIRQPLGTPLLILLALGLTGYALWDLVRAALFTPPRSRTAMQVLQRIGWAVGGVASGTLAVTAFRAALAVGRLPSDDQETQGWTAAIMAAPFGSWLVGVTGLVVVGVGLALVYRGWRADLDADLDTAPLGPTARRWILRFGRFGMLARGTVLGVIGTLLVVAVVHANPHEARGVAGALTTLARQPHGRWALGMVAAGLISHGLYEILRARFARFTVPTSLSASASWRTPQRVRLRA